MTTTFLSTCYMRATYDVRWTISGAMYVGVPQNICSLWSSDGRTMLRPKSVSFSTGCRSFGPENTRQLAIFTSLWTMRRLCKYAKASTSWVTSSLASWFCKWAGGGRSYHHNVGMWWRAQTCGIFAKPILYTRLMYSLKLPMLAISRTKWARLGVSIHSSMTQIPFQQTHMVRLMLTLTGN